MESSLGEGGPAAAVEAYTTLLEDLPALGAVAPPARAGRAARATRAEVLGVSDVGDLLALRAADEGKNAAIVRDVVVERCVALSPSARGDRFEEM